MPRDKNKIALEEFGDLLNTNKTLESEWQKLFEKHPSILAAALPIKFSNLFSQVRLESGNPDFIFTEGSSSGKIFGYSGVIELKRPQDNVINIYSSKHIAPSTKLAQARIQVENYIESMIKNSQIEPQYGVTLYHPKYSFIVMGNSAQMLSKCKNEAHINQLNKLLPHGLELITYDKLFEKYRNSSNQVILVDLIAPSVNTRPNIWEPAKFNIMLDDYDVYDHIVTKIMTTGNFKTVLNGSYRQTFGVPRKLWSFKPNHYEFNYLYEVEKQLNENTTLAEFLTKTKNSDYPYYAYEIFGQIDTTKCRWTEGVEIKLRNKKGETGIQIFDGWDFAVYEGDKIFKNNDIPFFYAGYSKPR